MPSPNNTLDAYSDEIAAGRVREGARHRAENRATQGSVGLDSLSHLSESRNLTAPDADLLNSSQCVVAVDSFQRPCPWSANVVVNVRNTTQK